MFMKRESFGFVPQLIGFIQHAYYASIEFNENTTNFKMITGSEQNVHRFLFDLPKLVFEILFPFIYSECQSYNTVISASMFKVNLNNWREIMWLPLM